MPPIPPDQVSRGGKSQNHALNLLQPEAAQTASAALTVHQRQGDRGSTDDPNADEDRFLSSAQVKKRYGGVSDMWLTRRLRDGSGFPKPMIVETRRFWKLSELEQWERARAKASVMT
jgi:hypothetical protein